MIGDDSRGREVQLVKDGHDIFARGAVNDSCLPRVGDGTDAREFITASLAMSDAEVQVVACETTDDDGRVAQVQGLDDIVAHDFRGGGGESDEGWVAEILAHTAESQIVRSEVVSPLAQTVRFINGQQAHLTFGKAAHEPLLRKSLGCDVENFQFAALELSHGLAIFLGTQGGVHGGSRDPLGAQGIHLVLHQRDERRNNDGDALPTQGRQLVAERLPAARRHDGQRVPSLHHGMNHLALSRS